MYVHLNVHIMATVSFKIRKGKKEVCPIYLIFSYGRGNELRYSTDWKLSSPSNWNPGKQRVKNVASEPMSNKLNQSIQELEIFFFNRYNELVTDRIEITNLVLRNELDIYLRRKKTKVTPTTFKTLFECYEWYYTYFESNPLSTTKKPLAKGTIKSYKTAFKTLKEFDKNMYSLTYRRVNLDFYSDFIEYLNNKGFSQNYVSNNIKMLKTIMNFAWEKKFHNNLDYKSRSFSKINEEVHNIYLNEGELEKLARLKLDGRMDNVRDLFLIAANTGLRISDFNRLTVDNIKNANGFKYLEIKSKKTNQLVAIPLKREVLNILEKRNGVPPYKMPEQNINKLLKTLGEKAEIDTPITITKTIGGIPTSTISPKYELMTSHCARRSFATNGYLAGMSTYDIMTITGHKTEKSFYKYIKVSNLERLRKIAEHPFFN